MSSQVSLAWGVHVSLADQGAVSVKSPPPLVLPLLESEALEVEAELVLLEPLEPLAPLDVPLPPLELAPLPPPLDAPDAPVTE